MNTYKGKKAKADLEAILAHGDYQAFPPSVGYYKDGNVWVAYDNSDGNCWVEEFTSEEEAEKWVAI